MKIADLENSERMFKVYGLQSVYIYQCKCNNKFNLKLDMRRKIRKNVGLPAYFINLAAMNLKDKMHYRDENSYGINHNCEVKDLSTEGIRIKTMVKHHVQVGDSLQVKFSLGGDGPHRIVEKKVRVHSVRKDLIGCEFYPEDKKDARIGFYLL